MNELVSEIRQRYLQTLEKIRIAAEAAGRDPESVKLVVVTKAQPADIVHAVIQAGATTLGENYPEEGVMKLQSLQQYKAVEWHMIGHVQSRKAQLVAQNFSYLHSLDSLRLARKLDLLCAEAGKSLTALLEFNLGEEESKSGWSARDESHWSSLLGEISELLSLPNLRVRGLMAMPPLGQSAEFSRPYFQKLSRLRAYLSDKIPGADFSELSMGSSSDYEVAVQEGATFVRVGTAIVGARRYKPEDK